MATATVSERPLPTGEGLTFEKVWAMFQETAERQKETDRLIKEIAERQKETERQMKETAERQKEAAERQMKETAERQMKEAAERRKETERQMKEAAERQKETDRYFKELGEHFGRFTNNFGDVVEYMIAPKLQEKFNDFGYDFQEASKKVKIRNKKNDIKFEIDVYLQNGDTAMLVEIKSKLLIGDVNDHIIRLEKMRKYADLRGDKRNFIGAVAGIVVEDKEREYALKNGFFLIEPNGDNFFITPPPDKPKEW